MQSWPFILPVRAVCRRTSPGFKLRPGNITRALVGWADDEGLEKARKVRVDATSVKSSIRHPLDSQLLYDSVRKVTALLRKLAEHYPVVYHNHCRRAKRRVTNIRNSRGQNRRQFYQDLVKVSGQTYGYGCQALESAAAGDVQPSFGGPLSKVRSFGTSKGQCCERQGPF